MAKQAKLAGRAKKGSATGKATRKSPGTKPKRSEKIVTTSSKASKKKASKKKTSSPNVQRTIARAKKGTSSAKNVKKTKTVSATEKPRAVVKKRSPSLAARPKTVKNDVQKGNTRNPESVASDAATEIDRIEEVHQEPALPKTYLTDKELLKFKDLLLQRRREIAGDVNHLSLEVSNHETESGRNHSAMPIHMADLGSDNWEQEFTLGLIANERERIRDIDEALARIDDKTYGVCMATHQRISRARLRAKPWAKYCIEYARAREEGRAS